jgi:hypothetical protein
VRTVAVDDEERVGRALLEVPFRDSGVGKVDGAGDVAREDFEAPASECLQRSKSNPNATTRPKSPAAA